MQAQLTAEVGPEAYAEVERVYQGMYGQIEGVYFMDHVHKPFKILADVMTAAPRQYAAASGPALADIYPKIMTLIEGSVVYWTVGDALRAPGRARILKVNAANKTVRLSMGGEPVSQEVPMDQLRTGAPSYANEIVFGLRQEHNWEHAKYAQENVKKKGALRIEEDQLPDMPIEDVSNMTGFQRFKYAQQVYFRGLALMKVDHGNKVTEEDYMRAVIKQMGTQVSHHDWGMLASQLRRGMDRGLTFAEMMEAICVYMRIEKDADAIFAMLATTLCHMV